MFKSTIIRLPSFLALLVIFASCTNFSSKKGKLDSLVEELDSLANDPHSSIERTYGEKRTIAEPFTELNIPHPWKVNLIQSDTNYIKVTTGEEARPSYLWPEVENGKLNLGIQEYDVKDEKTIPIPEEDLPDDLFSYVELTIFYKDLSVINLSNHAELIQKNPIKQDSIEFNLSSSAKLDLTVQADYVKLSAIEESEVRLKGNTRYLDTHTSSGTKIDLKNLKIKNNN